MTGTTREGVEALCAELRDYQAMMQDNLAGRAADLIQALRERAEAAERDRDEHKAVLRMTGEMLTAARRAGDAAWNDAIEAVRPVAITCFASGCDAHELDDAIRALRRAAPTEDQ